jgi:hypothetical protein
VVKRRWVAAFVNQRREALADMAVKKVNMES